MTVLLIRVLMERNVWIWSVQLDAHVHQAMLGTSVKQVWIWSHILIQVKYTPTVRTWCCMYMYVYIYLFEQYRK